MAPIPHPRPDGRGHTVIIARPHHPGPESHWYRADAIATFLPAGPVPPALNGIPFSPWREAPTRLDQWARVTGQNPALMEPPLDAQGKQPAAGLVIEEADGRVWIVCPTNQYAGCEATYPKGRADEGLTLQVTALKETFEETGLHVAITGFIGDFPGLITMARYYRAHRLGGTPAAMGWESQAVLLVPKKQLATVVNLPRDRELARLIEDRPSQSPLPPSQ